MDTEVFDLLYNWNLQWRSRYRNVELSGLYYQINFFFKSVFERNWSVHIWIQANISFLTKSYKLGSLPWILNGQNKMSMSFIKPASLKSIPNSTQIDQKNQETIPLKFLFSHTPVTLNQGEGQLDEYKNVECNSTYHHTKFESNPLKTSKCMTMLFFLMQSVKQQLFPLFHNILLKCSLRMFRLNCFITTSKFHPDQMESVGENEANKVQVVESSKKLWKSVVSMGMADMNKSAWTVCT